MAFVGGVADRFAAAAAPQGRYVPLSVRALADPLPAPVVNSKSAPSVGVALGLGMVAAALVVRPRRRRALRRHSGARPAASALKQPDAATTADDWRATAEANLLNNYGTRDLVMERGEGHYLFDVEGRRYLDFTSGIAVNCLGHSDPGWAAVVAEQAATLTHTSNMFLNKEQVALGEKLVKLSFADRAFFCNSGTEANEAAIKFARKYHFSAGRPREKIIAFNNAFHGRTMGALALTYKDAYKTPFQPLMPSVDFLPYNDVAALNSIDDSVCAVFVEPVQGEGGVVPADKAFMEALRKKCDETGAVLVFDEVQCGLGRTGRLFGHELHGVTPDLMTLAKPLAAGLPIGAVMLTDRMASVIGPGDHGSTFAGAPLVCAAGNYVIDRVSAEPFLANVRDMGERLRAGLRQLVAPRGLLVRGEGLLNAVVFEDAATCGAVVRAARELGLLVLTAGAGNVLRIAPALTVGAEEVDECLKLLEQALHHTSE